MAGPELSLIAEKARAHAASGLAIFAAGLVCAVAVAETLDSDTNNPLNIVGGLPVITAAYTAGPTRPVTVQDIERYQPVAEQKWHESPCNGREKPRLLPTSKMKTSYKGKVVLATARYVSNCKTDYLNVTRTGPVGKYTICTAEVHEAGHAAEYVSSQPYRSTNGSADIYHDADPRSVMYPKIISGYKPCIDAVDKEKQSVVELALLATKDMSDYVWARDAGGEKVACIPHGKNSAVCYSSNGSRRANGHLITPRIRHTRRLKPVVKSVVIPSETLHRYVASTRG